MILVQGAQLLSSIIEAPNFRVSNDVSNTSLLDLNRTNTTISSSLDDTAAVITRIAIESGTDSDRQKQKKIKKEPPKDDSDMVETNPKKSKAKVGLREVKTEIVVQRSARGRMIKPRMQTWAGERIIYDIDGNPICASSVTTRAFNESESSEKMVGSCYSFSRPALIILTPV